MKSALLIALALLFCHIATEADESPAPSLFYARDARTEIELTPSPDGSAVFEFHVYGTSREGRVVYHGGELTKGADGKLSYASDVDGKKSGLKITGKIGDDALRLQATGIEKTGDGIADVNGVYSKVPDAEILARVSQRYEAADTILNADYQKLRAELSARQKEELRETQRYWIEDRDRRANFAARPAEKPQVVPAYWEEMLEHTVTRIGFLKVFTGKGIPAGISGEYDDFDGGTLKLDLNKTGLRFSLEVVRGTSSHLGEIDGTATHRTDEQFTFEEEVPADEQSADRLPAELTFTIVDSHRIRIAGKNTIHHHGARAYFDGLFYKTGNLSDKASRSLRE